MVADRVGFEVVEDLSEGPITNVHLVEPSPIRKVLSLSSRQVVNNGDVVTLSKHMICNVRANETRTPGDQYPHRTSFAAHIAIQSQLRTLKRKLGDC